MRSAKVAALQHGLNNIFSSLILLGRLIHQGLFWREFAYCRRAWESIQQQGVGMMPIMIYLVKYLQHYKHQKLRFLKKKKKGRKCHKNV